MGELLIYYEILFVIRDVLTPPTHPCLHSRRNSEDNGGS